MKGLVALFLASFLTAAPAIAEEVTLICRSTSSEGEVSEESELTINFEDRTVSADHTSVPLKIVIENEDWVVAKTDVTADMTKGKAVASIIIAISRTNGDMMMSVQAFDMDSVERAKELVELVGEDFPPIDTNEARGVCTRRF
ncbi:hypothetical protein [Boseongicola aestuarii]|uniref:Uncharacterized protein n=1 Tax=Boseongicola aestuarii TaxID=1470561 RepID=A0A238IVT0_9RHOB|nr:hypothetical protein [Boseongicola aestuarii]SMX22486.1 hypothetical protein BOA8489_00583 [Boseongicola aestuarii]